MYIYPNAPLPARQTYPPKQASLEQHHPAPSRARCAPTAAGRTA